MMDIDQEGEVVAPETGSQIILPSAALPGIVHVIPQESRPFFPGQAIPLIMSAETWLPTLQAVKKREQDVVGIIATIVIIIALVLIVRWRIISSVVHQRLGAPPC